MILDRTRLNLLLLLFLCFTQCINSLNLKNMNMIMNKLKAKERNLLPFLAKEIKNNWSRELGEEISDLASLGYAGKSTSDSQYSEAIKVYPDWNKVGYLFKKLFYDQKWERIITFEGNQDILNYNFSIIRNPLYKKVVVAMSGTKSPNQLLNEIRYSYGETYYLLGDYKYQIGVFFHQLYLKIKDKLINSFIKAMKGMPDDTQVIFTGHSLGGAMATVALFDLQQLRRIKTTYNSPILITFGQPRTANYAVVNEIAKKTPIIFRVVNDNDIVTQIPDCSRDALGRCFNEYGKYDIDKNEINYKIVTQTTGIFRPWHLPGLILNKSDNYSEDCSIRSEYFFDPCKANSSLELSYHKFYFGYQITRVYNLSYFDYQFSKPNLFTPVWAIEASGDKSFWDKLGDKAENFVVWGGKKMGLINQ
jgi:hypothetical protein